MQNSLHVQSHHLPFFTFIIMSVETEMYWIWTQIKCRAGNQMTKTYPFSWKSFDYIITCSEEDAIIETLKVGPFEQVVWNPWLINTKVGDTVSFSGKWRCIN